MLNQQSDNSPRALCTPYCAQFLLIKGVYKTMALPGLLAKYCSLQLSCVNCQLTGNVMAPSVIVSSRPPFPITIMCSPSLLILSVLPRPLLILSVIDQCRECKRAHSVL